MRLSLTSQYNVVVQHLFLLTIKLTIFIETTFNPDAEGSYLTLAIINCNLY